MALYFITGNKGKIAEAQAILPEVKSIELYLPEIQSLDPLEIIVEKLTTVKQREGEYFVEDTALYIECLNGFPGPLIKWFLQTLGNEGIYELVSHYENKNVQAKTIIGYTDNTETKFFTGELDGTIVKPIGTDGFGWDPLFQPKGHTKTLAEMTREEKNSISMRKASLMQMKDYLSNKRKL
ncbi:MAG: non-canonical purine NTP pyrophosphatase [archaeon]